MRFNREDYGSRIRSLRKKRGLTQEQLAEKMNVSTPYIAKIENGKQTGPVELAVEFAEFFEVSLDYLLVGKGDFAEEQKAIDKIKAGEFYGWPSLFCLNWRHPSKTFHFGSVNFPFCFCWKNTLRVTIFVRSKHLKEP